jgi:ribosomal protein L34
VNLGSEELLGEVFRTFGQGLISMRRPCPLNLSHSAVNAIINGQGLSPKNRPCPKYKQTLPNPLNDKKSFGFISKMKGNSGKMIIFER